MSLRVKHYPATFSLQIYTTNVYAKYLLDNDFSKGLLTRDLCVTGSKSKALLGSQTQNLHLMFDSSIVQW